ncbi:SWIM zinc finger family protein [Thermopolyspora sp. NPDC052614]|uniref:SWIM zinc finger family protein n=1 Tax=Thermopolyspora sp. NPDC052614 TaxID=3155682 RepID=UPI00343F76AC
MTERWSRDQVLALAPDASSRKAAQGVGVATKWSGAGATEEMVFGECAGSGAKRYRSCVDLAETGFRCDCPSRKFPCKHALGLLLLWAEGGVPETDSLPAWAGEWLARRRERAARSAAKAASAASAGSAETAGAAGAAEAAGSAGDAEVAKSTGSAESGSSDDGSDDSSVEGGRRRVSGAAAQREERVAAGLSDLERWLEDQMRQGIAEARRTGPDAWADLHRRLIDVQAPGLAAAVARLPAVLRADDWPEHLLGEYALMYLLAVAYRGETGEGPLRDTIRSRVGFTVLREDVLAGKGIRDRWDVIGSRDEEQDRLTARRVWLRGRTTGRAALVLSFAGPGQALDASLVTGTTIDADLVFYPGASPLRALVATRHAIVRDGPPPGATREECLAEVARALAGDPWVASWPVVLAGVVPGAGRDLLLSGGEPADAPAPGVPLHPETGTPWRLIAVSGGRPVTVGAEWTPRGFRPLTVWNEETGRVVIL